MVSSLPANQLSKRRAAGDGGNTAFGLKPYFCDGVVLDEGSQFEYVAAGGILEFCGSVGARERARIARVLEVIEKLGRIHPSILANAVSNAGICHTTRMEILRAPKRIVSLQPSVTLTLDDLGKLDLLAACTKYCAAVCPAIKERKIPIVADSWTAQAEQIGRLQPDFVMASVPYQEKAVTEILKSGVPILALSPRKLADIYSDIGIISRIVDAKEEGAKLVLRMQALIASMERRTAALSRPKVFCEEWGKPLIVSQPWVRELVEAAGGEFIGTPGMQIDRATVQVAAPDVLVAAWCGAGDRVPLEKIAETRGWQNLPAVKAGRVYCIRDEYLNTPASTLTQGLQALAAAIHPECFPQVEGLRCMGNSGWFSA